VASVLFTGFLFDRNADGVLHREQVRAFAERVLGCEVDEGLVEQIMDTFDISGTGSISVEEMRIVTHPVEWRLHEF
jgi:Ca2+-binding EF-hand superfamily protein